MFILADRKSCLQRALQYERLARVAPGSASITMLRGFLLGARRKRRRPGGRRPPAFESRSGRRTRRKPSGACYAAAVSAAYRNPASPLREGQAKSASMG